jgi:hypothetical protein
MAFLFANGNFYKPVPPYLDENGNDAPYAKTTAAIKLLGFGVWIVVFMLRKPQETFLLLVLYFLFIYLTYGEQIKIFFNGKKKTTKR